MPLHLLLSPPFVQQRISANQLQQSRAIDLSAQQVEMDTIDVEIIA